MGYNLKNARNGKSISKIPKWQSLRSLALKNEILWRFEFPKKTRRFVWKQLLESKALLSSNFFHTNLLHFFKIQTVIKSHFLMLGTSNFAIFVFSICSFHFWHSLSYSPQYKRFLGKLWSRDPSCKGPIVLVNSQTGFCRRFLFPQFYKTSGKRNWRTIFHMT